MSSILLIYGRFMAFPKLVKNLKFIRKLKLKTSRKLPVTYKVVVNFLILLMKLIASLLKPLGYKCNPPLFNSFEVIFPLSITSSCKPCKCTFILLTVKEILPLSVRVIKLEMTTLLSGKFFFNKFL